MSQRLGKLYLVATPIGNLGDITFRALDVLKSVDFVICEDTRRSGKLLKHFEIRKPLRSLHDQTSKSKQQAILSELKQGASAALISDAGTPLISDPGFPLVRDSIQAGIKIESIPGAVAFAQALILSGLPVHEFTFFGYLPQKDKKRKDLLSSVASDERTLIFYESPHRIKKSLLSMLETLGDREASVSRELTKKFEETVRGKLSEISDHFGKEDPRGEFVVVVKGSEEQ